MDSMHVLDKCSQASGEINEDMMAEGGVQKGLPEGEHSHIIQEPRRETQRVPTLKREKSQTHTLERRKKRVKFCSDDGDIVVATHVFERQVGEAQAAPAVALTSKIKKLLKKRSNKSKCSMETQTDGAPSSDAVDTVDSASRPISSCSDESMVMAPSPCSSCCSSTPVNQVPLDDLIWGVSTPTRRSSVCSSVCTQSQDDEFCISSIEDSMQEEDEIYCESCCAAIQEECICDVTQSELSLSPPPPKEPSDLSISQEPLATTEGEINVFTVSHLSPYILIQAESPRSVTPTQQDNPYASTQEIDCIPLQQDPLCSNIIQESACISVQQEWTRNEIIQESPYLHKQENLSSTQTQEATPNITVETHILQQENLSSSQIEEAFPKSTNETQILQQENLSSTQTEEEIPNSTNDTQILQQENLLSSQTEEEILNKTNETQILQQENLLSSQTEEEFLNRSNETQIIQQENLSSSQTEDEIPNSINETQILSNELKEENQITNEELTNSNSNEVSKTNIYEEKQKNSISAREKEVISISTPQKRPCTPTDENSCSQYNQEPPDPPVTPSKRKRTSDCESPSVDITPDCEITKSPILRAPNVTPVCVTEPNTIKPVTTFAPGSARAKAAALLARARAIKAEETSKETSKSINVQPLTIKKDNDNSLVKNDVKLETQVTKAETEIKLETQVTKAETEENGSEIQENCEEKDQANSKQFQYELSTFIEKNKKCTENIEKSEENSQKNIEVSISKQIDPYQLKEKLENLENKLEGQLNETSMSNYKEKDIMNEDHIHDNNLAIEDSEIEINVTSSQENTVESHKILIDSHEHCQSENNLTDVKLPQETIVNNIESISVTNIVEIPAGTLKREGTFSAEDNIVEESTVSIKREGTFTLDSPTDDGPSPPKIVKPSNEEESTLIENTDTSATGAVPRQVKFQIPLSPSDVTVPQTDAPKSPRKIRLANIKNGKEKSKKIEEKVSPFSSTTTVPDKIKPIETPKISPRPTPKPAKSVKPSESPVVILRNSARKTIMNAWRKTTGTQDETNKSNTESSKGSMQKRVPSKSPTAQRRTFISNPKTSTPREVLPKIKVLDKSPVRSINKREKTESSLSGVFKRDPMPKWDNKSESRSNKKFDSEKERLKAEVNRLNSDRERLQSELTEARVRVEEEVIARRALRRTHDVSLRQLREGETRRTELIVADLRNRLEDEKRESLTMLKEAMTKGHEADLTRADRERDEEQRRIRSQAKVKEERLKAELRSQTFSKHEPAPVQCCHHDREIDRLNREILSFKENRKKLEDQVQSLSENERKHASELRRVHEEHEAVLTKMNKTDKTETMKLLDELRSKERSIDKLEHTVTAQSSKIRILEERTRAANSAGSVGRKHKDGRSREKDGCGSGASSRCSRSLESDISSSFSSSAAPEDSQSAALAAAMAAEVEALRMQVEQQRQEMEQQRLEIKERRQEMERERQELQATLLLEARERESGTPRPTWPLRRESCVKVCELPTVPEQVSDEEVSPLSSPDNSPTQSRPSFAPFTHELYGACDEYSSSPDTPTTFLSPITPGTEPLWPQMWENNISSQYAQLSREHQELQKSYQLLASTTSSVPSTPELLESIGGKDGPSEWWAAVRVVELETESAALRAELQEAQDQRDLLEFRILELEEVEKQSDPGCPLMCDQSTLTECCDVTVDSGSNISTSTNEDLSLPLSIDSGLDLSNDYKARVVEGRNWLNQLSQSVTEESEKTAAAHLTALLDWLANHQNHHALSMSPTLHTPTPTPKSHMGMGEDHGELGRDLMILAARLQESLADPQAQEPLLIDTIEKLRLLDTSLSGLQDRVVHLTEENRDLHDALQVLSDAHETRTEASGTESELVHRKTPSSLHSDLSDSESDSPEHSHQHRTKIAMLENTSSFQESGIFDDTSSEHEVVSSSTQTDMLLLLDGISKENLLHEGTGVQDEVNLQTAVARLAIIKSAVQDRDLKNMRISDLQESDEYLKNTLESEHITLSKYEYDSIVENERSLQQELEHLKCDKEQLAHDYETLKDQFRIYSQSQTTVAEQDLRGQMRFMSQQLECSERYRVEVFEEKCELEEAENDARLMVQRLESQIDAAREMENLLSASLSQEQEISRELQRRVRDLQVLEKGHRSRIIALESMNQEAQDRAATLAYARDALATQLTFAAYGLVLVDAWRQLVGCPSAALIPYNGSPFIVSPVSYPTKGPDAEIITPSESHSNLLTKDISMCVPNMCDVYVQTVPSTTVHMAIQANIESKCVGVQYQQEEIMDEGSVDHGQRRPAEDICIEDEPVTKKARAGNMKSQATMTQPCSEVTDREHYYLEQIESLQKEKMTLRKSQEGERRNSLQHHSSLEVEADDLRAQLREAEKSKCQLLFQIEEIEDQRNNMQADLRRRIEELKGDMSRYSDLHELEKKALRRDYEARISEVIDERRRYEDRVKDLELQLSTLRQELEIVGVSIANDLVEFDSDVGNMLNQKSNGSCHTDTDGDILTKIRELVKSETSFRQKITELEKKEYAYRETIREADKIMSSHVTTYKHRIEDLEGTIEQKNAKIQQLEASEERLRTSLRTNSRSSEGTRISDLLDRLIDTENSELKLKERVWNLEKNEKELQIKLMETEKTQQSLRGELRDQEEMVHRLMTLETENNSLSIELTQAQDSAHKLSDVQQNESYLRGRVEELEVTENMLRETLHQADLIMAQRERKLRDQVSSLEEEIVSYKTQLEYAVSMESQSKECEGHLKKQLEELRTRLAETERDLKESSSETVSHESQHRSEVTKMRNQLKLANSQLNELDTLNCALRDRMLAAEAEVERLATQTEESSRKHEQDLLSLNLQVSCKESRIKEMETQLEQMSHSNAVHELDTLSGTAIASLHDSINAVATTLKNCPACSVAEGETLNEVTSHLSTLTEVLEGRTTSSDSEPPTDTEEEEPHIEISVENLVVEATTTSPPTPAGEGLMEHTSGDVLSIKRSRRATRRRTRRLIEDSPLGLPFPGGSTTILDELEEKVRELEEAVSRKEEELRLADNEAHDLHSQLQYKDTALTTKSDELEQLNMTLANLRQQLLCTMEDYERDKLSLGAKHKIDIEELTYKVEQLTKDVERITSRGRDKDNIIATLSNQIRAILRSGNMSVVINQLRNLNKEGESINITELPNGQTLPDFDLDAVCNLLNQPYEMGSLPDPAIYQTGMELCSHVTCKSSTLSTPSGESTSHVTTQGSPTLAPHRKSRIPRLMPPSVPSVKSIIPPNKIKQYTVQSKVRQPVQPWGRAPQRFSYKTSDKQQNVVASSRASPTNSAKPASTLSKSPEVLYESQSDSSLVFISEPTAQINAFPKVSINNVPSTPASEVYGTMKPLATSTPAKTTGRKDSTRRERSTRFVSDARKIKRMVTGIAPLDAAVDCASAPEWQERLQFSPSSPTSSKSSGTFDVEATCVPRPQELRITRRVGVDGVVIAWAPLEHDCVAGFQVLVGGRVVQHVRSPHRTKALVTGLPLAGTFTIGLVTIANDGRCSTPVLVTQDRSRIYAAKKPPKMLRRAVPTAL